jgi:uridylate kinase
MGMLATMINSLALKTAFEQAGLKARVMAGIDMPKIAEPMRAEYARKYLQEGEIVLFGAGTGNPFFTTDSAAALRAAEIKADVLLKATKVDGIYSADPVKNPEAKRYTDITYHQALSEQLRIMDAAAFSLCMDNRIPIIVFNFFKKREIVRVLQGEPSGTRVHE